MTFRSVLRAVVCGGALVSVAVLAGCAAAGYMSPPAVAGGDIVMRTAAVEDGDPFEAGRAAAEMLKEQMGSTAPHVVLLAECFEDEALKRKALEGICSVFPPAVVFGGATYGCFGQAGCLEADAVGLLGIGGEGIAVAAAREESLGVADLTIAENENEIRERLHAAGERLAAKLPRSPDDRLLIIIADAHSPKNGYLVEGVQKVVGAGFPMTGGSANKNAGQTFVYAGGAMYKDSAVALLLSGDFTVSQAGRRADENDKVIATAHEAAAEALGAMKETPLAVLAFDCAGRKGKLEAVEDELAAMQEALGQDLPLFGCYCAGEIGPADVAEKKEGVRASGVGWHVMITVLGRK